MTFAQAQDLGDMAYDMTFSLTGDNYEAATAYEAVVMQMRSKESGVSLMWLCPACEKVDTPAGSLCHCCQGVEDDWRSDLQMYTDLAHGG